MKFSEIKDLSKEALLKRIFESQKASFDLRMKHSLGQLQNPLEIRKVRREVGQLKTALWNQTKNKSAQENSK